MLCCAVLSSRSSSLPALIPVAPRNAKVSLVRPALFGARWCQVWYQEDRRLPPTACALSRRACRAFSRLLNVKSDASLVFLADVPVSAEVSDVALSLLPACLF